MSKGIMEDYLKKNAERIPLGIPKGMPRNFPERIPGFLFLRNSWKDL